MKKKLGRPKNKEITVRRHKQILETAAKTFAEYGYPNTDVQAIADILKIGKGTIYRYFSTKKELFMAAVDRGMKSLSDKINNEIQNVKDPLEKFAGAIRSYLAFFDEYPEYVELIIQQRAAFKENNKPSYIECWQELCKELVAQNKIRNIPTDRVLDVVNDLLHGTIFTNYFSGRCKSFESQAKDILDIMLHGILDNSEPKQTP